MTLISPLLAVGGQSARSCTREGPGGPTGPAGWVQGRPRPPSQGDASRPLYHPLQPPWGFRGPLRCTGVFLAACWLGTGYTPALPTRLYPPWYPPGAHAGAQRRCCDVLVTTGTCTYDRFEDPVGEPRGLRTHPGLRVPGWFILYLGFTRPFAVVSTEFMTGFTELWTRITELWTRITELWTRITELWTRFMTFLDLPHASLPYGSQKRLSVIIS